MSKLKKRTLSYIEWALVRKVCESYQQAQTSFGYACKRNLDILKKPLKKFDDEIEDKRVDLAAKDKEKNTLLINKETGSYETTPEAQKEFRKFVDGINEREIEIEVYICKDWSSVKDNVSLLTELSKSILDITLEEIYGVNEDGESKNEETVHFKINIPNDSKDSVINEIDKTVSNTVSKNNGTILSVE